MARYLACLLVLVRLSSPTFAQDDTPFSPVEIYLHDGRFADGERDMLLELDRHPENDEARFGLGILQFCRAIENVGSALHSYGMKQQSSSVPILRLPIPVNDSPQTISYEEFRRVFDCFANDLSKAESTLSHIQDENVKLRIRLLNVRFHFAHKQTQSTRLIEILDHLDSGWRRTNPVSDEFRVHFDRGDVAWLRAYCHLLIAFVDGYCAFDTKREFESFAKGMFPKVEGMSTPIDPQETIRVHVSDPPRLRQMRMHLIQVCKLNAETWKYIRQETDDDFEWLPHPTQRDQLGIPLTDSQIDDWLRNMQHIQELLDGERLLDNLLVKFVWQDIPEGLGLNVKTLLNDPPVDFLDSRRIQEKGIDGKYLEEQKDVKVLDLNGLLAIIRLFDGPFGFARAVRLN